MAFIHCNLDHSNDGDGDGWLDQAGPGGARQTIKLAVDAAADGDTVYLKGTGTQGTSQVILDAAETNSTNLPVYVFGVKDATENLGSNIVVGDLIPGILTGSTVAYEQAGVPEMLLTGSSGAWRFDGKIHFYGIKITAGDNIVMQSGGSPRCVYDECLITWGVTDTSALLYSTGIRTRLQAYNSKFVGGVSSSIRFNACESFYDFVGCIFTGVTTATDLFDKSSSAGGMVRIFGCDLTGCTSLTSIFRKILPAFDVEVHQCIGPSGVVLTEVSSDTRYGNIGSSFALGADPGSPLISGQSFQDAHSPREEGDINQETVIIRTGGANDGASGGFSLKLKPFTNRTLETHHALYSDWLEGWVDGDGNSKTVTMYIANSGASDYQDDDVEMEINYPSEDGNIKGAWKSTRIDLLKAPVDITDDTVSVWGSGGNNRQKLSLTIEPDYSGPIRVRIGFFKTFSSSPETLYVDPKLDIA